ncbi:hypothetical protein CR513_15510, partial [Mucuna pruriens]
MYGGNDVALVQDAEGGRTRIGLGKTQMSSFLLIWRSSYRNLFLQFKEGTMDEYVDEFEMLAAQITDIQI